MSPASAFSADDHRFMQLALALGRRGLGNTWPNPAVGAVIVKNRVIVGRGWTQAGGRPHAEPDALSRAGSAAEGATLYVTLEPCSHHGKSPPCADAVIAAGIERVVAAMEDPNPEVAGQGHARLRNAGIAVDVGLCAEEAARDHAGHIARIRKRRPHVTLKLALSSDGKVGASENGNGKPVALTEAAANVRVHLMRAQADVILIGVGTALADDPVLTCRLPGMESLSPVRVVLDSHLRLPPSGRLAATARQVPLWLMAGASAEAPKAAMLGVEGATVIRVAQHETGVDLHAVMAELHARGISRLMVEGGASVAASFVAADLVDEAWLFETPKTLGPNGVAALRDMPLTAITSSPRFSQRASERFGPDRLSIYERT